ncbi:MAG: phosphotransferase family protein [Acidimicrobiia bacterium]|nr:phosphotransferase family protein [Acidimicrobiia bacterium]
MSRQDEVAAGLLAFLAYELGVVSELIVSDVALISSIGNAREPWSFNVSWCDADGTKHHEQCVMLLKAGAGQLETTLAPEFDTIRALGGSDVPLPRALWCDESGDWLGQGFFVTAFVPGTATMRPLRVEGGVPELRSVALDLARATARLHRFDWRSAGLSSAVPVTVDDAALTQLAIWEDQFERQRLEPHPALVWAFEWLRRNAPTAERVAIVHGDLRFGNVLYEGDRLMALLDWEMTHLGDPVEDLGWVYRALWSPERSLPFSEFLAAYEDELGSPVDAERLRWYQAFSEVKHSVISLTGARSFADRLTLNLRHADRAETVPAFLRRFFELVPAC